MFRWWRRNRMEISYVRLMSCLTEHFLCVDNLINCGILTNFYSFFRNQLINWNGLWLLWALPTVRAMVEGEGLINCVCSFCCALENLCQLWGFACKCSPTNEKLCRCETVLDYAMKAIKFYLQWAERSIYLSQTGGM